MRNYNDGTIKNLEEIENPEQAIHDFAEGSEALEDLLKFCYENGIKTKACCRGHQTKVSKPYILFEDTALNYLSNLEEFAEIIDAEITYIPKISALWPARCGVYCNQNDLESSETFFKNIQGVLEYTIENNEEHLPKSFELIDKINDNINRSFFLNGKLAPRIIKNKKGTYIYLLINPWSAVTESKDSTTLFHELEEIDNNRINPCQMTLDINGLSQYAEKIEQIFSRKK